MQRRRLTLAQCFRIVLRQWSNGRVRMLRYQLRAVGGMPMSVRAVERGFWLAMGDARCLSFRQQRMKRFALLIVLLSAVALAAVDINKPIAELKLKDGRTLKNVTIMSIASSTVMAKWDGGRGTIAFDQMPDDLRSAIRPPPWVKKSEMPSVPPQVARAPIPAIKGQMFERDPVRGEAFRYVDQEIAAYPLALFEQVKKTQIQTYRVSRSDDDEEKLRIAFNAALKGLVPIAKTRTDADGKFEITIPDGQPVFLHARGLFPYKGISILRMWAVDADAPSLNLTGDNRWEQWRQDPSAR